MGAAFDLDTAPLIRLREGLQLARREGQEFDVAWAQGTATFGHNEHKVWAEALEATRPAWREAWEGKRPPALRDALAMLDVADEERPAAPQRVEVLG